METLLEEKQSNRSRNVKFYFARCGLHHWFLFRFVLLRASFLAPRSGLKTKTLGKALFLGLELNRGGGVCVVLWLWPPSSPSTCSRLQSFPYVAPVSGKPLTDGSSFLFSFKGLEIRLRIQSLQLPQIEALWLSFSLGLHHSYMVRLGLCSLVSLSHSSMRFRYFVDEKNIELPSLCCLTCVRIDYALIACTIEPRGTGSRLLPIAPLRNSTAVCRLSPGLSLTLTIVFLGIVEKRARFIVFAPYYLGIVDTYCSAYSFMEVVYTQYFSLVVSDCIVEKRVLALVLLIAEIMTPKIAWKISLRQVFDTQEDHLVHLSDKVPRPLGPHRDTIYGFVDVAWNAASLNSGAGWIFTSQKNDILLQGSSSHQFVSSLLVAETLALKAATHAAIVSEYRELYVLSDSQSLLTLLSTGGVENELKSLLYNILCLLRSFSSSISFSYVSRNDNVYADSLAKEALRFLHAPIM